MTRIHPKTRSRTGRFGDAGETLVEILTTITILGIAGVAVITGIGASARSSGMHRTSATADVVLVSGSEAVKGATSVACATLASTPTSYDSSLAGLAPTGWTLSSTGTCNASSTLQLQTITVTATAPSSGGSESVVVMKRSP